MKIKKGGHFTKIKVLMGSIKGFQFYSIKLMFN